MGEMPDQFICAINVKFPLIDKIPLKTRYDYYKALEYYVLKCGDNDYFREFLRQYKEGLNVSCETDSALTKEEYRDQGKCLTKLKVRCDSLALILCALPQLTPQEYYPNGAQKMGYFRALRTVRSLLGYHYFGGLAKMIRKMLSYRLLCDLALIVGDETAVRSAAEDMCARMNKSKARKFMLFADALCGNGDMTSRTEYLRPLFVQYRKNRQFMTLPEKRFIITANMSSGKSTLINSIIGKKVAKTAQEACTGSLSYIYNKPFDDGKISIAAPKLNLNAHSDELKRIPLSSESTIAAYFSSDAIEKRVCLIDTPGVNSAINLDHGKITKEALKQTRYDVMAYILNATQLGTDDEMKYLRWIHNNLPDQKMVFVLNKLDRFKASDDSIQESIEGAKNDLISIGFKDPVICPVSAYCAYLIKLKKSGAELSEDELDDYGYYAKKFGRSAYDLSVYYNGVRVEPDDSEETALLKRCGAYGFEKILFGGV